MTILIDKHIGLYSALKRNQGKKEYTYKDHKDTTNGYLEKVASEARRYGSIRPIEFWGRGQFVNDMFDHISDERVLHQAWKSLHGEASGVDGIQPAEIWRYTVFRKWAQACQLFGAKLPEFVDTIFPEADAVELYLIDCLADPTRRYRTNTIEFDGTGEGRQLTDDEYAHFREVLDDLRRRKSGFFATMSQSHRQELIRELDKAFSKKHKSYTTPRRLPLPGAYGPLDRDSSRQQEYRTILRDVGLGQADPAVLGQMFLDAMGSLMDLEHHGRAKAFVVQLTPLTHMQRHVDGDKNVLRQSLEWSAMRWIRDLVRGIARNGKGYRPGPLRQVEIPKADGGVRVLSIPPAVDRIVAKAAQMVLQPAMEEVFLPCSVGCRNDKDRFDALAILQERYPASAGKFLLVADIQKAFDQVPHDRLLTVIQRFVRNPHVLTLLERIVRRPGYEHGYGIAQGDPLSPLFLNMILHETLDEPLSQIMEENGLAYFRYVDDISVFGFRSRDEAEALINRLQGLLEPIGLELHTQAPKTQIVDLARTDAVLGMELDSPHHGEVDRYLGLGLRGGRDGELEFFLPSSWQERIKEMYHRAENDISRNGYAGRPGAHSHILHATQSWIQAFAPALSTAPREPTIEIVMTVCHATARHTEAMDASELEKTWTASQEWWLRKRSEVV